MGAVTKKSFKFVKEEAQLNLSPVGGGTYRIFKKTENCLILVQS